VRVTRETAKTTGNDSTRVADDFRWAGLRGYIATPLTQTYYSGTSLVGLRIRASERLSSAAEKRVRVRATRRLPIYGYGYNLSKNPISAVIDTLLNEHYGAQLSANELDIPLMLKLYNYWGGASTEHGFNAVFDGKSTIYEALRTMLAGNAAEPLPVGGMVSVTYEGARDFPMMIFGEANIIKGTFQLSYQFDKIGDYNAVRVQYRTLDTWQPEYAYYPDDDPTNRFLGVELFGCTSSDHALQFATYTYNKRFLIRKTINFETELEGLIPRAGDLIGLSHSLPKWSVSGYITAYNPSTMVILLDREVEGFGFSGSEGTLILRQDNGTGIDYITGQLISPREVQISSQPAFNIYGSVSDTPTLFIWGENNSAVRLFTITNIEPRGGVQVSITAQEYKPEAFENAMPYLENSLT
jgi:predicted phage tail protein